MTINKLITTLTLSSLVSCSAFAMADVQCGWGGCVINPLLAPNIATALLPPCGANNAGEIKWDTTALSLKVCNPNAWSAVGGGGGTWDAVTSPVGNQSLTMAAFTTTWTWNAATGAGVNLFSLTDTTNNTGTGVLLDVFTASGSALLPVQFTAKGTANGVQMTTAGAFTAIGTGLLASPGAGGSSEHYGIGSTSAGASSTVVGNGTTSAGTSTVVLGQGSSSVGNSTVVVGQGASASSVDCVVVGQGASCIGSDSVIIGKGSTAVGSNIILGTNGTIPGAANNTAIIGTTNTQILDMYVGGGVQGVSPLSSTIHSTNITSGTTNTSAGNLTLQSGLSTGNAVPTRVEIKSTVPGASGTTQQSVVKRVSVNATKGGLTSGAATSLFDITLNTLQMAGGTVLYCIDSTDGADMQNSCGEVSYSAVNKGGVFTTQVTSPAVNSTAASAGALTAVFSLLNGANKVTLQVTPTATVIVPTTLRLTYEVHSQSFQDISIL